MFSHVLHRNLHVVLLLLSSIFFLFLRTSRKQENPQSSPEPLPVTHACLLDCSAFQDPIENCLFFEHLVDALQPTSWLLPHLSHPNPPSSGLCCYCHSERELPKWQIFCPFSMLLCSSRAAPGESSQSLWFLVFTHNGGWKVSCIMFNRVWGNKGKKPVTSGHKGSPDLPKTTSSAGIPIPSWMWWLRKSSRLDNELFMSRSCLFTLLQSCEWPVHEKHPGLWAHRGNLHEMSRQPKPPPQQTKTHCFLKRPPESWPSHEATQRTLAAWQSNEHMSLLLGLCSRRTLHGIPPALTHQLAQQRAWWKAE